MATEEICVPKVMSLNPSTVYWMDIFYIYLLYELQCLIEKTKINEKEAEDGHF